MLTGTWRAGDFNGDNKTDLAHLCCYDYAHVWISHGDGNFSVTTFQPAANYWVQAGSWSTGDFNGDGRTDLVHQCCSDTAATWLSRGDGSFEVAVFRPWANYWIQPGSWQSGDLNGDGRTDLVHLCCYDTAATWLSRGDGTYDVTVFRPWPNYWIQAGSWKTGDLNGDGRADLIHLCCYDTAAAWLSRSDGHFDVTVFQPWGNYWIQPGSWQSLDLNADHRTDLVHLCCYDTAAAWMSRGTGHFEVSVFRPWADYWVNPP
jgi:hypothetical protein